MLFQCGKFQDFVTSFLECMFGSTFEGYKIDSRGGEFDFNMFGCIDFAS